MLPPVETDPASIVRFASSFDSGTGVSMRIALLGVLAVLGCGGASASDPGTALVGTWTTSPDASGCLFGFTFGSNKAAVGQLLCSNVDGTAANDYVEKGTYVAANNVLTIEYTASSCPTDRKGDMDSGDYTLTNNKLVWIAPQGALILTKLASTDTMGGTVVTFGCFDSNTGIFTPSPLAAIK